MYSLPTVSCRRRESLSCPCCLRWANMMVFGPTGSCKAFYPMKTCRLSKVSFCAGFERSYTGLCDNFQIQSMTENKGMEAYVCLFLCKSPVMEWCSIIDCHIVKNWDDVYISKIYIQLRLNCIFVVCYSIHICSVNHLSCVQ